MNNNASDTGSRPLETYLPDDYINYVLALNETVGFEGKIVKMMEQQLSLRWFLYDR